MPIRLLSDLTEDGEDLESLTNSNNNLPEEPESSAVVVVVVLLLIFMTCIVVCMICIPTCGQWTRRDRTNVVEPAPSANATHIL